MLADKIVEANKTQESVIYQNEAIIHRVTRKNLLENVDNWNRFIAIANVQLSNIIHKIIEEELIVLGDYKLKIRLIKFGKIIKRIGINRGGDLIKAFNLSVKGNRVDISNLRNKIPGSYPIVIGNSEDLKQKISFPTDKTCYVVPSNDQGYRISNYMSRLLIPNRIRWNTTSVLALYSDKPILANVYFMVQLNCEDTKQLLVEKALSIWFASIWGILFVLMNREETEGAFTRLNIGQWKLLPVIDFENLSISKLKAISNVFERFKNVKFSRITNQFTNNSLHSISERLELDMAFLEALDPHLDHNKVKTELLNLYELVNSSISIWR
jgi:hypothetical protein